MSSSPDSDDLRRQIAADINTFLGTLNLRFDITADDVKIVPGGAKITKKWGDDIEATVVVGFRSLNHLSMASGIMGWFSAFSGRGGRE